MNNIPPEFQEVATKVVEIVDSSKEAIFSGWKKIGDLSHQTDFIALLEPTDKDVSVLIMPRVAGLSMLGDRGFPVEHENLRMLHEAATGLTPESTAIWVVVLLDNKTHVTKLVNQPMSRAGSA
jgi:hypothetical protein